jgi:hypothetical protein
LAKRNIKGTDTPAYRSRQGPLNTNQIVPENIERFIGQPVARFLEGFLSGHNFLPIDFSFSAIRLFHCGIKYELRGWPNIYTGTIAFNKGDRRIIGYR